MKFIKLQLLIIALVVFVASSAFAAFTYDVSIDTSSLSGQQGYLYLDYYPGNSSVASIATVANFATNGTLGSQDTVDVMNGAAVSGTLPSSVVLANTNGANDYLQAVTFGNTMSFSLSLLNTQAFTQPPYQGGSVFSFSLSSDALGSNPLITPSGTLFTVTLNDDGTTTTAIEAAQAEVTPTPIPAAAWLLGSGLVGLGAIRRKKQQQIVK